MPDEIDALGEPVEVLPRSGYWSLALVAIIFGATSAAVFVFLMHVGVIGPAQEDDAFRDLKRYLLLGLPGYELLGLVLGLVAWWQVRKRVHIGPNGFALGTPTRCKVFLWSDIKKIRHMLKVQRVDGCRVRLINFGNHPQFYAALEEHWVPLQVASARKQLEREGEVSFGALKVTREGIRYKEKLLQFADVGHVVLVSGDFPKLEIFKKGAMRGPWCVIGIASVYNEMVIPRLVAELANEQ